MENTQAQFDNVMIQLKQDHSTEVEKLKLDLTDMQGEFEVVLDTSKTEYAEKVKKIKAEFVGKDNQISEIASEKQAL